MVPAQADEITVITLGPEGTCHERAVRRYLDIGEIDTTWVVYGHEKRFKGEVIGIPSAHLFGHAPRGGEPTPLHA